MARQSEDYPKEKKAPELQAETLLLRKARELKRQALAVDPSLPDLSVEQSADVAVIINIRYSFAAAAY